MSSFSVDFQTHFAVGSIAVLASTALLNLIIALLVFFRSRPRTRSIFFVLLLFAISLWSFGYTLEVLSKPTGIKLMWLNIGYLGISPVPALLLTFILKFTRESRRLKPFWLILLYTPALLTAAAVWTNPLHGLFRMNIRQLAFGPFSLILADYGPLYWAFVIYSYPLLLASSILLFIHLFRLPKRSRGKAALLLVAVFAPWVGDILHTYGQITIDLGPLGFTVTGLAVFWAIFRYRLFSINKVAYRTIVKNMVDPVLVLDEENQIVSHNKAARNLLNEYKKEAHVHQNNIMSLLDVKVEESGEVMIGKAADRRYFDLQVSTIDTYKILVFRDISEKKKMTDKLLRLNSRMQNDLETAAELQKSILPEPLPPEGKVKAAWRFQPCEELAGDVFDIYPLNDIETVFYILDTSGHGVAASLLSFAAGRLINSMLWNLSGVLRPGGAAGPASAIQPVEIAKHLNELFPFSLANQRYLTFLFGIIDTEHRILRYTTAGHPPLLHVPAQGEIRLLSKASFPIGFTATPLYEELSVPLSPGDRIYVYSDGIIEGLNPDGEQFGYERLGSALSKGRARELEQSLDLLLVRFSDWIGDRTLDDDISLLAVEILS